MDEVEMKIKELEIHAQTLREIIWERYRFFPLVSELAIALIAIVALNFLNNAYLKVLATAFLCLAVVSLWLYIIELRRSEEHVLAKFSQESISAIAGQRKWKDRLRAYAPHIILAILSILVLLTILYLWGLKVVLNSV